MFSNDHCSHLNVRQSSRRSRKYSETLHFAAFPRKLWKAKREATPPLIVVPLALSSRIFAQMLRQDPSSWVRCLELELVARMAHFYINTGTFEHVNT